MAYLQAALRAQAVDGTVVRVVERDDEPPLPFATMPNGAPATVANPPIQSPAPVAPGIASAMVS